VCVCVCVLVNAFIFFIDTGSCKVVYS
jgi:hypothetical protein